MPTLRRQRRFGFRGIMGIGVGSRFDPMRQGLVRSNCL